MVLSCTYVCTCMTLSHKKIQKYLKLFMNHKEEKLLFVFISLHFYAVKLGFGNINIFHQFELAAGKW